MVHFALKIATANPVQLDAAVLLSPSYHITVSDKETSFSISFVSPISKQYLHIF